MAAAPQLDPPGVFSVFQGLRVLPSTSLKVLPPAPNSGVLLLPMTMPPRFSSTSTSRSERLDTLFAWMGEPKVVRTPLTSLRSLMARGRPPSQPLRGRRGRGVRAPHAQGHSPA